MNATARATMGKVAIILVVLVLLAGGGAAAYVLYFSPQDGEQEVAQDPDALPVYVEFNPIMLPVLGDDGIDQFFSVLVTLEVADASDADRVIAMAPRLNDAHLTALYGSLNAEDITENGILDLRQVKRRLVNVSNQVLGREIVQDALIQTVSQRFL